MSFLLLAAAVGAAAGLIGWSSISSALALERTTRLALAERQPSHRSLRVLYYTLPLEGDYRAANVQSTFASYASVLGPVHRFSYS